MPTLSTSPNAARLALTKREDDLEGPAAHLLLERGELRRFLEELQAEYAVLGQPPEGPVPADK